MIPTKPTTVACLSTRRKFSNPSIIGRKSPSRYGNIIKLRQRLKLKGLSDPSKMSSDLAYLQVLMYPSLRSSTNPK